MHASQAADVAPAIYVCLSAFEPERSLRPANRSHGVFQIPAFRADPGKYRVMVRNFEPALFRRDVTSDKRDRNLNIEQRTTCEAMHMIVPLNAAVISARLVGERQFLNQTVLSEKVQRPIDRAVCNAWVAPSHTLEDLASRQMLIREANLLQNQ